MSAAITVLVADDEPDLRLLVRVVLEQAGFQVIEEAVEGRYGASPDGDRRTGREVAERQFGVRL